MSCECKPVVKSTRNYYQYYDTPEGCDVTKKILATSRLGAVAGILIATQDVLLYSHAVGFGPIIRRYVYHTAPFILMGATFSAVANSMLQYRKVDDHLNYFVGGFACGPILAAYVGSYHAVLLGGLFLGTLAAVQKEAKMKGGDLFPIPISHMGTINGWRHSYGSLYKDPLEEMQKICDEQLE